MSSRLQALNLSDFDGGLNLRDSQFSLQGNESPEMLNVEIDVRGGFASRVGWQRWNATDIVASPTALNWLPRTAWLHPLENGGYVVYVANDGDLYAAGANGVFSQIESSAGVDVVVGGAPHLADGVSWGNDVYIACGHDNPTVWRDGTATYAPILTDAFGNYNDDYTSPTTPGTGAGTMPRCEHLEAHAGYLFAAYTKESADYPNRLRWSHPAGFIEDWASEDYLDIGATGGYITGLISFRDRLLVFKTDGIFAVYGYSSDNFYFERVPGNYGAPHPQAITRSETAVYFYSSSGTNGIYAYVGDEPIHISDKVKNAMRDINDPDDVWLGWIGRRLWCSIPWKPHEDLPGTQSTLIFDPETGEGSWVLHRSALGDQTCIVDGSDRTSLDPLAAIEGSSGAACLVRLESRADAADQILESGATTGFNVVYRTRWLNAGWPERAKSWRRPRMVFQIPDADVTVDVTVYTDYYDSDSYRSGSVSLTSSTFAYWRATGSSETDGFEWGDGSVWSGGEAQGATVERLTTESKGFGLGVTEAIQLRFSTNANDLGSAWGLDHVTNKYLLRRFTT